jgi:hypothetical protein
MRPSVAPERGTRGIHPLAHNEAPAEPGRGFVHPADSGAVQSTVACSP